MFKLFIVNKLFDRFNKTNKQTTEKQNISTYNNR